MIALLAGGAVFVIALIAGEEGLQPVAQESCVDAGEGLGTEGKTVILCLAGHFIEPAAG